MARGLQWVSKIEEVKDGDRPKGKTKKIKEKGIKPVELNKTQPVCTHNPPEIMPAAYSTFYESLANGWRDYLGVIKHFPTSDVMVLLLPSSQYQYSDQ